MKRFFWSLFEIIETLVIAVVAVFLVRTFIAQPFLVDGLSMEPTFHNGDYLLIDELTYRFRAPERGEPIVFRYPKSTQSPTYYIKRIVGLPGERVVALNGEVKVFMSDGRDASLHEPYVWRFGPDTLGKVDITLGPSEYFVMGDNRNASFDSRSWGPLAADHMVGIARFRLWPIATAAAFRAPAYAL